MTRRDELQIALDAMEGNSQCALRIYGNDMVDIDDPKTMSAFRVFLIDELAREKLS